MKNILPALAITFFIFSSSFLFAQNGGVNYNLMQNTGQKYVPENFNDFLKKSAFEKEEVVNGKYYRIVQFYEVPTASEKRALEGLGIEFLNYYPHRAFIAAIPKNLNKNSLKNKGIRAILPMSADMKVGKNLVNLDFAHESVHGEEVEVLARYHENINPEWVISAFNKNEILLNQPMPESKVMMIQIPIEDINRVAALPFISYLEIKPELGQPEEIRGRSLHRANGIDTDYPSGRHYNGEGVGVLVRDDGLVGPHIDFKGREIQNVTSNGVVVDGGADHADGVAGIMAGAGNLDPDNKGMAWGSDMHVIRYGADFIENLISLNLHQIEGVLVVNSSFSNGCNSGYTSITETVDRHIYENPTYIHVFSGGNSNGSDCDYGAGDQWGNITGGHKQGKNVLTTANLDAEQDLANSSSRGPAHDGRIKPDISAHGAGQISTDPFNQYSPFGGTSAAAPGVAGVTGQLHQAYRDLNGGETAPSALLKAAILNTANDMGNVGPDFRFGWGHLNVWRAFNLLKEERYERDEISQGENKQHNFTVPAGAVQVRFMVYWNEESAFPGTSLALINDIDMIVTDPDGTTKLPFVLDPTPDPTTLNLPATNGEDHLNNVEQILFDDPVAGDYTIDLSGFSIPQGPQEYFIMYEIITEEVTMTYPIGGEGFVPGDSEHLRWDAYGNDGSFDLAYTTDDGATWNSIINNLTGSRRYYIWNIPNQISGQVRVRVTRNGFSDESDANLSICRVPTGLGVVQFCPNFMRVKWNAVTNATGYDVFLLGEKFMDSVGTTTDLEYDIPLPTPLGEHWFSVRAKGDNGLRGKRANAVMYDDGLLDCILQNDVATTNLPSPGYSSVAVCDPFQDTVSIVVENTSINDQPILSFSYQFGNGPVVTEDFNGTLAVGEVIEHTFETPIDFTTSGLFELKTWSTIPSDDVFFNDTIRRNILVSLGNLATPTPNFEQGFESLQFPPSDWFISNPDDEFSWEHNLEVDGPQGDETRAAMVRNRFYNSPGTRDEIFSIPLDFTNLTNPILTFDLAYALFTSSCSDTLLIEVYTECGDVYAGEVYNKSGADLSTSGFAPTNWFPSSSSDWRNELVSLTDFAGETVILKIVNINGNCNNLFIDNINIADFAPPVAEFFPSSTEVCIGESIQILNTSTAVAASYAWNFGTGGSLVFSDEFTPPPFFYVISGDKTIQLIVENDLGIDTFSFTVTVLDDPFADFDYDQVGSGYQFNNDSDDATSYLWDFGDGTQSVQAEPYKEYLFPGNYTVQLTAINDCAEDFDISVINVTTTNVEDLDENVQIQIIPNPNDGVFHLKIEDVTLRDLQIQILDVRGRDLGIWQTQSSTGTVLFPIERSNWTSGLYFVKVQSEDGVRMLKMTVQ